MRTALIGYTGFVGGNLANQFSFDDAYNSKNIEEIQGKKYDLIVSAGTSSLAWKANQAAQEDWGKIKKLLDSLKHAKAKHLILISTINAYPKFSDVDERTLIKPSPVDAYGKNRYRMELFIKKKFPRVTIIRFPQIYGPELKKNFVFDLINDNALNFTHKDTRFQWYDVRSAWKDIQIAIKNNINLINFAVEPIPAWELAKFALGWDFDNITEKPPMVYDMQTIHGAIYDSPDRYLYHREETLEELKDFIRKEKKTRKNISYINI